MKNESALAIEIWELFRDQITTSRRLEMATALLRAFSEYGTDAKDLHDVVDEEPYLAKAYRELFEDEDEEEYEDEDYED